MQQADFNYNDFDKSKQTALDDNLLVKFFHKTRPDKQKTAEEGRPIFKEVEYIDIKVAGSAAGACRPARPNDIERFPRHYQAFKNRIEAPIEGTPLAEWPAISRSLVEQFAFMNIKTVEQLANLNDTYCSQIMGGHGFKQKAKDFLKYSTDLKVASDRQELLDTNEQLLAQNEHLSNQLAAVMTRLDAMEAVNGEFNDRQTGTPPTEVAPVETSQAKTALDTPETVETPEELKRRKNREYQQSRRAKAKKK